MVLAVAQSDASSFIFARIWQTRVNLFAEFSNSSSGAVTCKTICCCLTSSSIFTRVWVTRVYSLTLYSSVSFSTFTLIINFTVAETVAPMVTWIRAARIFCCAIISLKAKGTVALEGESMCFTMTFVLAWIWNTKILIMTVFSFPTCYAEALEGIVIHFYTCSFVQTWIGGTHFPDLTCFSSEARLTKTRISLLFSGAGCPILAGIWNAILLFFAVDSAISDFTPAFIIIFQFYT